MPSANGKLAPVSFDARLMAPMRCVLAAALLLVMALDPGARASFSEATYLVLGLYVTYSIFLYTATRWWEPFLPVTLERWLDVGWAIGLTMLCSDPSGIFAGFLVCAILITTCPWGVTPRCRMPLVMAILLLCVGMIRKYGAGAGISLMFMAPAAMAVADYRTASFRGQARRYKQQLALLTTVSRLSKPRYGIERTLGMLVEQLRAFYDADACLLITPDNGRGGYQWRRAERQHPDRAVRPEALPTALTRLVTAWRDQDAVVVRGRHAVWRRWLPQAGAEVLDHRGGTWHVADAQVSAAVATMLDAVAFMTVPLSAADLDGGRLYITAGRRDAFDPDDAEFLLVALDQTLPVLQNIKLVDQIAADAADAERRRIALDFHDRLVQPYIGLQIGLAAVRQKLSKGNGDVTHEIDWLLALTNDELAQLRHLVQGLKSGDERVGSLIPAIQRFGRKFTAATGILVQVEVHTELFVSDHVAAEVFNIVAEGLSNIRRHTPATTAGISFVQEHGYLRIQIRNDGMEGETFMPFTPRSITERATALGGEVRVERQSHSHAAVIVEIPL